MNDLSAHKILIIDDDAAVLKMLSKVLSKKGYLIDTADNGEEGIKKIESNDYGLILTDIIMPGISGKQVAYLLKDIKEKQTPIVGMSGMPWLLDEDIFDAVLTKPCTNNDLWETVEMCLNKKIFSK